MFVVIQLIRGIDSTVVETLAEVIGVVVEAEVVVIGRRWCLPLT